ncbi:hypothetical protein [Cyanobium sp. CH-040]|uniref:hypothetical protein n=1 Tax=Cyanobium sp. CH-040 TaxID=2823708 RepID=UPI0020CED912|nr:hypothetical protein [Cyanobium sp. CH-040]MCP9928213.1 hypothetical protein [Cyanobium sp. CH-040]
MSAGFPCLRVRAAIPHFFQEGEQASGYGSGAPGARLARSLALARCLGALLDQRRAAPDLMLDIGRRCLTSSGGMPHAVQLEVHVFTTGGHALSEVLAHFGPEIHVHAVELNDPRQLALITRDWLIAAEPIADLSLYLEDDLVIADPLFFAKQHWFTRATEGRAVLMPHRHEAIPGRGGQRLLVDGPLRDGFIRRFATPQPAVARGRFAGGPEISFDRTANPHAGLFCLDAAQVERRRQRTLPNAGFIGPLETAATLTALEVFEVWKPALAQRSFLWVEHGHPRFTAYADRFVIQEQDPPSS